MANNEMKQCNKWSFWLRAARRSIDRLRMLHVRIKEALLRLCELCWVHSVSSTPRGVGDGPDHREKCMAYGTDSIFLVWGMLYKLPIHHLHPLLPLASFGRYSFRMSPIRKQSEMTNKTICFYSHSNISLLSARSFAPCLATTSTRRPRAKRIILTIAQHTTQNPQYFGWIEWEYARILYIGQFRNENTKTICV